MPTFKDMVQIVSQYIAIIYTAITIAEYLNLMMDCRCKQMLM